MVTGFEEASPVNCSIAVTLKIADFAEFSVLPEIIPVRLENFRPGMHREGEMKNDTLLGISGFSNSGSTLSGRLTSVWNLCRVWF